MTTVQNHITTSTAGFPKRRSRRLRRTEALRAMVRETTVNVTDLIYPLFVTAEKDVQREIPSMPGVYQWSVDRLPWEIESVARRDIPAVILFGIPDHKDDVGSGAYPPDGVVQQAIRQIKSVAPDLLVITDVCLCEYTDHGHCGIVANGEILNDPTIELLTKMAVSHAEAGADIIAPSDMMDGRVGAIRDGLDRGGFADIAIMAYSAKYASGFYGPFREAAQSAPQFGDRRSYQMDPANVREALTEVEQDILEGADFVMVKPALAYLDVIRLVRDRVHLPIAAYNVSGEYSMVKAAAANGWIEERRIVTEMLTGIKRAGADLIITYFAKDFADWLSD